MDENFKYVILSGIVPSYIEEYFLSISDYIDNLGRFHGNRWMVELETKKENKIGAFKIPMTIITFIGEEKSCNEIIKLYRLKFLSAGG